jgi:TRAP-type C4-dicarboxylate transport system substrate-binding protein
MTMEFCLGKKHAMMPYKTKRRYIMKHFTVRLSCVVCITVLFCLFGSSLYSAEKVTRLRYAVWFPATHPMTTLIGQWCKDVEKRTNGAVKITPFPGGTLANPTQVYEGVLKGSFDIGT